MEEEVEENGPSFPSNYVTIHELKQRWLLQQQEKPLPKKSNPKPTIDDSKIPPVPRINHHRSINQRKSPPSPTVHNNNNNNNNYDSKTPRVNAVHDSASKTRVNVDTNQDHKIASRNSRPPKPRIIEPVPVPEEEKKQYQAGHRSRYQKSEHESRPQPEAEPVEEKKQHHRNRNQKPTPFAPHNHDAVVVEGLTVASPAPVKEQHRSRNQKPKYKTKTPPFAPQNDYGGDAPAPAPMKEAGQRSRNQKPKYKTKMPPFDPQNDDSGDGDGVGVVPEDVAVAAPVNEQHQAGHQSRNQNPKHKTKTAPFTSKNDDVALAAPVKEQHQAGQWSSKKKVFRPKTSPFDVAGSDDDVVKVEAVVVTAPVKLQHQAGDRSRSQKPKHESKTPPFDPQNDDGGDGVGVAEDVALAAPVKEQHQHGRRSRKKKMFRPKTPPFDVAGSNDAIVEVEAEAVAVATPVKLQHQAGDRSSSQIPKHESKTLSFAPQNDDGGDGAAVIAEDVAIAAPVKEQAGRWSRNKKVFRPKAPLFDVVVDGGSGSGSGDDDGVVAAVVVAASVKEINVSQRGYRRGGFEGVPQHRTWPRKPSFGWKKEQISQVWVKKGESAPN